jgi:hypothetical protein
VGAIAESMRRFGFRDPLAANRRTHEIEEGHGRIDALSGLKSQGSRPPRFVRVTGNEWFAPVLWFDDDRNTQEAYALAHNRTQEIGGGWDDQLLAAILTDASRHGPAGLKGTGWDDDDVDRLLRSLNLDGALATQELSASRSCPKCQAVFSPFDAAGKKYLQCPTCHARLDPSASTGGASETVTMLFAVTTDQRELVLNRLREIQRVQHLSTMGSALVALCEQTRP